MKQIAVIFFIQLFCTTLLANHIIDSSTYYGEFFVKRKNFFGMLCTNQSNSRIRVTQGSTIRDLVQMHKQSGMEFTNQNKYFKSKCGTKNNLYYYSGIMASNQTASSQFKIRVGSTNGPTIYPKDLTSANKEVGILYHTWHCPYSSASGNPIHNQQEIKEDILISNSDRSGIGPLRWPHWKDRPFDGYYCLNNSSSLIKKHAAQLINAGVDYIYFDLTNAPRAYDNDGGLSEEFKAKYHRPIKKILDLYRHYRSQNLATPQVVAWVGSSNEYKGGEDLHPDRRIARWIRYHFNQYAEKDGIDLHFYRGGQSKPLLLFKIQGGDSSTNQGKYVFSKIRPTFYHRYGSGNSAKSISDLYDTKGMWAHVNELPNYALQYQVNGQNRNLGKEWIWSFKEKCATNSNGTIQTNCMQRINSNKQMSVVAFYQGIYAIGGGSVARRRGRTFYQQFQQVFTDDVRYINISGWNAWISKRMCRGPNKFGFVGEKIKDENDGYQGTYGNEPRPFHEEPFDDYNWYTTLPNGNAPNSLRHACDYVDVDNRWHLSYTFPGEPRRDYPTFLDMFAVDHSRDMEPDRQNSDCYYQLMRNLVLRAKAGNGAIGTSIKNSLNGVCDFNLAN